MDEAADKAKRGEAEEKGTGERPLAGPHAPPSRVNEWKMLVLLLILVGAAAWYLHAKGWNPAPTAPASGARK